MKSILKELFFLIVKLLTALSNTVFFFRKKTIKRILLIPDFDDFGGTKTYFKQLLDFYAGSKFEISVFISARQEEKIQDLVFYSSSNIKFIIESEDNSSRRKGRSHNLNLLNEICYIWLFVRKLRSDMVVVSTGEPGKLVGACILPVRFLYILHTYPMHQMSFSRIALLKNNLGKTKKILTVSCFARENILKFWRLHSKDIFIDVIYNSVFNEHLRNQLNSSKENKNGKIKILTLGHVENYKKPELWIEVAQKIVKENQGKDIEFIWVGNGSLIDKCREQVRRLGTQQIQFVGFHEDVTQFYEVASIYFQPSLVESHGISVLEAMFYKIPCVVSSNGGLPESVIDGVTGLVVDIENIEEMTKKINLLINNESLRQKMGELSHARYSEKFSYCLWKNNMTKLHGNMI